jgi:hypothetical protein
METCLFFLSLWLSGQFLNAAEFINSSGKQLVCVCTHTHTHTCTYIHTHTHTLAVCWVTSDGKNFIIATMSIQDVGVFCV